MMNKLLWLSLLISLLAGCKSELNVSVKFTLLSQPTYTSLPAQFSVSLDKCVDDTMFTRTSASLMKIYKTVSALLPEAKFVKCYTEPNGVTSALFTLPLAVGEYTAQRSFTADSTLYVLGSPYEVVTNSTATKVINYISEPVLLALSDNTRKAILNLINSETSMADLISDFQMMLYLENDTNYNIEQLTAFGVYVNNKPYGIEPGEINIPAGSEIRVKVSNILLDQLLRQNSPLPVLGIVPADQYTAPPPEPIERFPHNAVSVMASLLVNSDTRLKG